MVAVADGGVGTLSTAEVVPVHPLVEVTVMVYVPAARLVRLVPDPLPDPDGDVLVQLHVYGPPAPVTVRLIAPLEDTQEVGWVTLFVTESGHNETVRFFVKVTVFSYPSFATAEITKSPGVAGVFHTYS